MNPTELDDAMNLLSQLWPAMQPAGPGNLGEMAPAEIELWREQLAKFDAVVVASAMKAVKVASKWRKVTLAEIIDAARQRSPEMGKPETPPLWQTIRGDLRLSPMAGPAETWLHYYRAVFLRYASRRNREHQAGYGQLADTRLNIAANALRWQCQCSLVMDAQLPRELAEYASGAITQDEATIAEALERIESTPQAQSVSAPQVVAPAGAP
jgi:hypothetical protein